MSEDKQEENEYKYFLSHYGKEVPPQQAKDALFDRQIINLGLIDIATIIQSSNEGTILDIGCGNGIILHRLMGWGNDKTRIEEFTENSKWKYLGVDDKEKIEDAREWFFKKDANNVGAIIDLRRIGFMPLEQFYDGFLFQEFMFKEEFHFPLLTFVRNVFHELDIVSTSELVYKLMSRLNNKDTLFVQDLEVFPQSERGRVCWKEKYFRKVLKCCGFDPIGGSEPSRKGNAWFTLKSVRNDTPQFTYENVYNIVVQQKKEQLNNWKEDVDKQTAEELRPRQIELTDHDLQKAVLTEQLKTVGVEKHCNNREVLEIPLFYSNWVMENCKSVGIESLIVGSESLFKLPDIFIPLYIDNTENGKEGGNQNSENIEDLIIRKNCLLVEGQAKLGKTTLLRRVAYRIMRREFDENLKDHLPVIIFLEELISCLKNLEDMESFEDIFKEYLIKIGLSIDIIKVYCEEGKVIFLIDGLDEINLENRKRVINALAQFREQNAKCKMILFGRSNGIDSAVLEHFCNNKVKIRPLIKEEVERFIREWFYNAYEENDEALRDEKPERMVSAICDNFGINKLIETPLMLISICILYCNNYRLFKKSAELYSEFIEKMISISFEGYKSVSPLINNILNKLANNAQENDSEYLDKKLAEELFESLVIESKEDVHNNMVNRNMRWEEKMKFIEKKCGLIKYEDDEYKFCDLIIQKFLTAQYIIAAATDNLIGDIESFWDKDRYHEVIILVIELLSLGKKSLANRIVKESLEKTDSFPFKRWRLASLSLSHIHKVDREESIVEKAKQRLGQILRSKNDSATKEDVDKVLRLL